MKSVNYFSHLGLANIQDIKASALYFDKITVLEYGFHHPKGNLRILDEDGIEAITISAIVPFTQPIFKVF